MADQVQSGMQTGKSLLMQKMGGKFVQAFNQHKNDKVEVGSFGELPSGVEGVAQLKICKVEVYKDGENAGKPYWTARGVVVYPATFKTKDGNIVKVAGKPTSQIENLFDTPKATGEKARRTFADHLAHVMKHMKLLGVQKEIESLPSGQEGAARLEQLMAVLEHRKPYFAFSTISFANPDIVQGNDGKWRLMRGNKMVSKRPYNTQEELLKDNPYAKKEPRVFHMWEGVTDYVPSHDGPIQTAHMTEEPVADGVATEEVQPEPVQQMIAPKAKNFVTGTPVTKNFVSDTSDTNGTVAQKAPARPDLQQAMQKVAKKQQEEAVVEKQPFNEFSELEQWGTSADGGDGDEAIAAAEELKNAAVSVGIEADEDGNFPGESWSELASLIQQKMDENAGVGQEGEATEAGSNDDGEPVVATYEVGQMVGFTPPPTFKHPRTKKPYSGPVQCEIVEVDGDNSLATLKNTLDNGKTVFKDVPFSALIDM